jgi:hypothetical protein
LFIHIGICTNRLLLSLQNAEKWSVLETKKKTGEYSTSTKQGDVITFSLSNRCSPLSLVMKRLERWDAVHLRGGRCFWRPPCDDV